MSNHLKNTTSPYLLQHVENPINWYPWCKEAFEKAKSENKPIFLRIGYSTCHWCHVMAHESFENEKTAEYILREMTSSDGGFYSAQDADSEGVERKFYTFTLNEIIELLGEEKGKQFAETFDITEYGNFEGVNIPNLLKSNDLNSDFSEEISKLYNYRKNHTKLHFDDKILLSWNSMMIAFIFFLFRSLIQFLFAKFTIFLPCFSAYRIIL